ncbi:unnamed protein product [Closterium sp. NIES-54]
MRMAGPEYSTASYITHVLKGLPRNYNLIKRMTKVPGTRESLEEDSLTSYILQDEAMQEAEQPKELFPQASYAAPTKANRQQEKRGKPSGGGNGDEKLRKEKHMSNKASSTKDVDTSSGKGRGDGEASCSMVGVVEPTVSLVPEAGEDFQAVAAAVQANPMAVLLDNGCSHHQMGTKAVFVDMAPSDGVKHVRGFNGALQVAEPSLYKGRPGSGWPTEGEWSAPAGRWRRDTARRRDRGGARLSTLYRTSPLHRPSPCSTRPSSTKVVALRTIVSATKSTPDRLHASLAHVGVDTIKSSATHAVATGLDIMPSTGSDPPCVSCVEGKLTRHTFPTKGSNGEEALAVVHIDLCGPFRFQKWLVLVERQAKKLVLMLRSDRGGEFLRKDFTNFVDRKGIVHDLLCPYTPQQNGMAEREMRTAVESVQTMLLHMGVQHHWWHLALRQAVWVRNCLERSTTPSGTKPFQLLTGKNPDLMLAQVWGCMVQFMVPEQQRGGKLAPKSRWGLHLGVSPESKGCVQVLGRAGHAGTVAAAPPPLTSAATVRAPAAAPVAPPLPSPAAAAAAPAAAAIGNPALPSPAAVVTPLLSPAESGRSLSRCCSTSSGECCCDTCPPAAPVAPPLLCLAVAATTPAAAVGTPALPSPAMAATAPAIAVVTPPLVSPAVAVTPPLLSPDALTETAAAAAATGGAAVTPPLLSPDAPTETAATAATVTPPLLSLDAPTETAAAAAVTPLLLSHDAPTETAAAAAAAAAAAVPSQTAPTPPSPTCLNATLGSGNVQCMA